MGSKIDLGGHVIIFSDPDHYQQCVYQIPVEIVQKKPKLYFFNTLVHPVPTEYSIKAKQFYYIPYNKYSGILTQKWTTDNVLRALSIMNPNVPFLRKSDFGYTTPQISPLAEYGRNFPNGKGLEIPNSWEQTIKNTWGNDTTASATVGNTFGPGNNSEALSSSYFHQPRMSIPGGPLDTYMMLNSRCNQSKDPQKVVGTFPESTNFGSAQKKKLNKRTRFGNNYSQMGPAYGGSNQITPYGGGKQIDTPEPPLNPDTWVGSAKPYKRLLS